MLIRLEKMLVEWKPETPAVDATATVYCPAPMLAAVSSVDSKAAEVDADELTETGQACGPRP